ncbi:choice-of-anchor M domain-containing protein [Gleimia sp. 6138-11-ORH1]|uniref:choice-of-anchor M domain-containing protein n=1 Tax=Gleimia sp. 6138-11-ORH1 TaxID=2973937 RepID=UPI0021677C0C|nr:choice-of-anchor M domain-containing protein [Gleimia sp. 6138-11-ORH1]MCS4485015.1 choice-of-anchor M domain-containing protein [Gleimia sp. 6138-11-ORH1]
MKFWQKLSLALIVGLIFNAGPALATVKDPNLDQTVTDSEMVAPAGQQTTLGAGHIDLGPIFQPSDANKLEFMARDDTSESPVWRQLSDVVFTVGQPAEQVLPEGGAYDFTGKKAGETVWALPQTQVANVPWLGWNTQSPKVVETFDRGITFEYLGHQGPGQFTVFLQAGGFGEPQVLWTSAKAETQAIWVDLLTHTHANWVFTEPGVHLVKLRVKGTTKDGRELQADGVLRFAVGETETASAFSAQWDETKELAAAGEQSNTQPGSPAEGVKIDHALETSSIVNNVVYGSLIVGAIILALIMFFLIRGKKAQKAAISASSVKETSFNSALGEETAADFAPTADPAQKESQS